MSAGSVLFSEGSIRVDPLPDIGVGDRRFSAFWELLENIDLNKIVKENI